MKIAFLGLALLVQVNGLKVQLKEKEVAHIKSKV